MKADECHDHLCETHGFTGAQERNWLIYLSERRKFMEKENEQLRDQLAVAVEGLEQIAATCVGDKPTLEEQIAQRALAAVKEGK